MDDSNPNPPKKVKRQITLADTLKRKREKTEQSDRKFQIDMITSSIDLVYRNWHTLFFPKITVICEK